MSTDVITRDELLTVLARHIGKDNGATATAIVTEITRDLTPNPAAERRVRALVTELRLEGHHVCAHPQTGYFMAHNDEELKACCAYLYDRAMASLKQIAAMRRVSLPDLAGQLGLDI